MPAPVYQAQVVLSAISEGNGLGRPSNSSGLQPGSWCIAHCCSAPLRVTILVVSSWYLHSHVRTSVFKLCLCFLCLHRNPNVTRSANPRVTPSPAPTAASLLEHDGDVLRIGGEVEGDVMTVTVAFSVPVAVLVRVAVLVMVAAFAMLVDVDPVVRSTITFPASRENGA